MAVLFGLKSSPAMAAGVAAVPDRIARLDASFHDTAVPFLALLTALGFKDGAAFGIPTPRLFVGSVSPAHSACMIGTGARHFSAARGSKRPALVRLIDWQIDEALDDVKYYSAYDDVHREAVRSRERPAELGLDR